MAASDPHVIAEFMNSLEKKLDILRKCYVQDGGFGKLAADSAEAPPVAEELPAAGDTFCGVWPSRFSDNNQNDKSFIN